MSSNLVLHRGARLVDRAEVDTVDAPSPTATWFPLTHSQVLDKVCETLDTAGFKVSSMKLALSASNARFFGTLDLTAPVVQGVSLCVGLRNSVDKSFPIAFCAGHRVFVCDNLAFRSEITVARKHTKNGHARFHEAVCGAVQSLHQFKETEATRIRKFQQKVVTEEEASHLMLTACEAKVISYPLLPRVLHEWRKPSFEEFQPRTLWSLFNAFTTVLGPRQQAIPQQYAAVTIRLQDLLGQEMKLPAHELILAAAA